MEKKWKEAGLPNNIIWNVAAVGKLAWWVASKKDSLWVKWVNSTYLKGPDWLDYKPSANSSWAWRRICSTKDIIKPLILLGEDSYSISHTYYWLMKTEMLHTQQRYKIVWNKMNVPKHCFVAWLSYQDRLLTRARMRKMNMLIDSSCPVCDAPEETAYHLFGWCPFACKLKEKVEQWIEMPSCLEINGNKNIYNQRIAITNAIYVGMLYATWKNRNLCVFEGKSQTINYSFAQIQRECPSRMTALRCLLNEEDEWLERVGIS